MLCGYLLQLVRLNWREENLQSALAFQRPQKQPTLPLKGLHPFGNCQRPVFLLGVSQHLHTITNLSKFGLK